MFAFKVVTPHGIVYEDEIEKVTLPTKAGVITVHENHSALVSVVSAGEMNIHKQGYTVNLAISGGVVEVRPTREVYVLADTAERAEHIDVQRAEERKKRAEQLLSQADQLDDVDYARIQALLEKELARISVAKKYR